MCSAKIPGQLQGDGQLFVVASKNIANQTEPETCAMAYPADSGDRSRALRVDNHVTTTPNLSCEYFIAGQFVGREDSG